MQEKIVEMCRALERECGVKILFAIENGSRAWRMESADSDYDVRFVFVRPLEAYLSLARPIDVIERMDGDIDLVGFDVYKFLGLLAKSNPTTIEWLYSDIVYVGEQPRVLREWVAREANWLALYRHYRSLCRNNYEKYIKSGAKVTGKKYLYVFRGLVNARFVERFKKIPPIDFRVAIEAVGLSDDVKRRLHELIDVKKSGGEADVVDRVEVFDEVVDDFLNSAVGLCARVSDKAPLDAYVKQLLL